MELRQRSRLYKDLHASAQTQYQMERRLFLNVVISKSTAVLQLLASEDQALLVWGYAFLILNLGLDIVNCVR